MLRFRVLFLACVVLPWPTSFGRKRNVSEITYRFTNCESSNRDGPRVNDTCIPFYKEMGSPLANPGTVFQFENGSFNGAQGFRLPRDGLYNITVAGASGGEGVCNYHYGLGGVIRAQVRLTTDYEYLILVGHKGTSVCDVPENADHPICQLPRPTNLTAALSCEGNWTSMSSSNQQEYSGGGGGGGASMIWPRTIRNKNFTDLPLIISPGGGGASAILDYTMAHGVIANPRNNLLRTNSTDTVDIYSFHIDGHRSQYNFNWPIGTRGFSSSTRITSGAGGGWGPLNTHPLLDIDGRLLSQAVDFAEGGSSCRNGTVFTKAFGGYGSGGGGCGSGGGGGGYTGGHVLFADNRVPGSGGDAVVFPIPELLYDSDSENFAFNNGDGYVEIVPSNCGCAGECVVYTEERQFECLCPNGTILAEDGSTCYQEIDITVTQVSQINFTDNGETYFINSLQFSDSSYLIFGLEVSLTVSPKPGSGLPPEEVACAIVFVGQNSQSVLASNPVNGINTDQVHQLAILGLVGNNSHYGPVSDHVRLLNSSVLVRGAFLVTNGECSLGSSLQLIIESVDGTSPVIDFQLSEIFGGTAAVNSARLILQKDIPPTRVTSPPVHVSGVNVGLVIGLVVAGLVLAVGIFVMAAIVITCCMRTRKMHDVPTVNSEYQDFNLRPIQADRRNFYSDHQIATRSWTLTDEETESYNRVFSAIQVSYNSLIVGEEIGRGSFGIVYEGKIRKPDEDIHVAIKTVKNVSSSDELKKFLEESLLMKDFDHPNVLGLAGVCFDTPDGKPFIILPFMANGNLKDFLKKKRTHVSDVKTLPEDLAVGALIKMCMDIASGMEYLAEEKFVHRDLAARNCMVDTSQQIKVGDFGLARDIYMDAYYRASQNAVVPVKWMAPEALLDGIGNEKTDVWSFGVTCWEVFSLGRVPYPGLENKDMVNHITKDNGRLEIPSLCPRKMYELSMRQCWQLLPEERPTFSQLVQELNEYWEEEHSYEHAYSPVPVEEHLFS